MLISEHLICFTNSLCLKIALCASSKLKTIRNSSSVHTGVYETANMIDKETTCGAFNWRPKWLQMCASKKVYLVIYSLLGVIQGMFHSYLGAVLSTLERQFGIKSKESAYIMSGRVIYYAQELQWMHYMLQNGNKRGTPHSFSEAPKKKV